MASTIHISKGDAANIALHFTNSDGTDFNLTGSSVRLDVAKTETSTPVISKTVSSHSDPTHGITAISLTSGDTDIAIRAWKYQLTLIASGGGTQPSGFNNFVVTELSVDPTSVTVTVASDTIDITLTLAGAPGAQGPAGPTGPTGPAGQGVATGGTAGQVLTKNSGTNYDASWAAPAVVSVAGKTGAVTLVKADVGLGNVDNTSDANKPISTATQAALDLKASKALAIAMAISL